MFRVHLSIISKGVNEKSNLQISCICLFAQQQLFQLWCCILFLYLCSCTHVHTMTTIRIDYYKIHFGFSKDRKFDDKSGSSILFLAGLGHTKRLVLPPAFVLEGCNIGSCTHPSNLSAAWRCKHCMRIRLLHNLKNACSL